MLNTAKRTRVQLKLMHAGNAILSLHDVMPETLPKVREILGITEAKKIPPFTLLVVPGLQWSAQQKAELKSLQQNGYVFGAHGWVHQAKEKKSIYHLVHSKIISRNVAEHLSHTEAEVLKLMLKSREWFLSEGFQAPSLYVPPAWALGFISRKGLQSLPYDVIEILNGLIFIKELSKFRLPMVGFEADNSMRRTGVRTWNMSQLVWASRTRRPLRIGLHPFDFDLLLAQEAKELLSEPFTWNNYPANKSEI